MRRDIAIWNAKPMARSGIGYLTNDVIAEVAEEFADLPPHATTIATRDVRKAFENSLDEVYRRDRDSGEYREPTSLQVQNRARLRLRHAAFGTPEEQLKGRAQATGLIYFSDGQAAIPQAIIDEVFALYPALFAADDQRKKHAATSNMGSDETEVSKLLEALQSFLLELHLGRLPELPLSLYGQGLQEKVEARARAIADEYCRMRIAKLEANRLAILKHQEQEVENERHALTRFEELIDTKDPRLIAERNRLLSNLPPSKCIQLMQDTP